MFHQTQVSLVLTKSSGAAQLSSESSETERHWQGPGLFLVREMVCVSIKTPIHPSDGQKAVPRAALNCARVKLDWDHTV